MERENCVHGVEVRMVMKSVGSGDGLMSGFLSARGSSPRRQHEKGLRLFLVVAEGLESGYIMKGIMAPKRTAVSSPF